MCGRFTLRTPLAVLAQQFQFDLDNALQLPLRYNIAPTQDVAAVRMVDGKRKLALLRWGLIPSWAKDTKIASSTINARADTVATKPAFRTAYKRRRCLVLADGYYEWLRVGKAKQPYLYEVDGGKPFALAGLWEQWGDKESAPLESCSVITTDANKLAQEIHDRMPVILDPVDYDAWLNPESGDVAYLLDQFPADRMTVRPVSTFVNNARNQGPECIASPSDGGTFLPQ
jgi:putative SOS response-associated peptidase YedK